MLNPEGELLGLLTSADIVENQCEGIFGHRITLLDFSRQRFAYFCKIGKLVEFLDEPGIVETALVLSGSAAQSRI